MALSRTTRILLLVAAVCGLLAVLEFLPSPAATLFWTVVFDAGHAPLFGLLALAVLAVGIVSTGGAAKWRARLYPAAFLVATAVGLLTEAIQFYGPRDADAWDALRNVAGAISFLLFFASFDGALRGTRMESVLRRPAAARAAAVVVLATVLIPVGLSVMAYRARDAAFPRLYDFDRLLERPFYKTQGSVLEPEPAPEPIRGADGGLAGRITYYPWQFPVLTLREPYPDWTGYEDLVFTVYSEMDQSVPMILFLDDLLEYELGKIRYERRLEIVPGVNHIKVPLAEIEQIDLGSVRRIDLYAIRPQRSVTLWLDAFRLEGCRGEADRLR